MANARRIEKINVLLREVISDILSRNFPFPERILVTVTRVAVSEDLYYAQVFVSVFSADGNDEQKIIDQLSHSVGLIQRMVNRRIRMRPVPRITFEIDQDEKRRERIEKLLSEDGQKH